MKHQKKLKDWKKCYQFNKWLNLNKVLHDSLDFKQNLVKSLLLRNNFFLKVYFDRVDSNSNGMISPEELQSALTNGNEDFPFQMSTVKCMLEGFHVQNKGWFQLHCSFIYLASLAQ